MLAMGIIIALHLITYIIATMVGGIAAFVTIYTTEKFLPEPYDSVAQVIAIVLTVAALIAIL